MNFNKYLELEYIKKELEELREDKEKYLYAIKDLNKTIKELEEENKVLKELLSEER